MLILARRGKANAAIAHGNRGHAIDRGGGQYPVPGRLAIIMGMDIDKAGRDQGAVRLQHTDGRALNRPNRDNLAAANADTADQARLARAIYDQAILDQEIEWRYGLGHESWS